MNFKMLEKLIDEMEIHKENIMGLQFEDFIDSEAEFADEDIRYFNSLLSRLSDVTGEVYAEADDFYGRAHSNNEKQNIFITTARPAILAPILTFCKLPKAA